jgi:hypothetical protein
MFVLSAKFGSSGVGHPPLAQRAHAECGRPGAKDKALICLVGACVRCDHVRCDVECLSSAAGSCYVSGGS